MSAMSRFSMSWIHPAAVSVSAEAVDNNAELLV
jgi:hypothetical protein